MGSIYQVKKNNRWRVQFSYRGKREIGACFSTYEEAKEYHDKIDCILREKKAKEKLEKAIKML